MMLPTKPMFLTSRYALCCLFLAADPNGATVRALRECLSTGTVLGDLFGSDLCGGGDAEWYDLTALRTEAGATRQPIHYDTPYQKVPGLFCAFIAMSDVEYSKGATVFLPGTHKNTAERRAFEEGGEAKDAMLSKKVRWGLQGANA